MMPNNLLSVPKDADTHFGLFDKMLEGVQVISKDWKYLYLNEVAIQHSRLSKDQLIDHTPMELYPGIEQTEMFSVLQSVMANGIPQKMVNQFDYPDGSSGYFSLFMEPIKEGVIVLSFDITEQKLNEIKLSENNHILEEQAKILTEQSALLNRSLNEKIVLIKEIHHRVKNNLQIIVSILHLQSNQVKDESLKTVFESFEGKINALAAVHHMLYSQDTLQTVDLKELVNLLSYYIVAKHKKEKPKLELDISLAKNNVNIDTAISFGLLLNEILSNAVKFGHKKGSTTTIFIKLKSDQDSNFEFTIGDNGPGIPEKILANYKEHLGLCLIEDLISQLEGTYLRHSGQKGTHYDVKFREILYNAKIH